MLMGEIKRIRNDPWVVTASRKISNKYTQSLFLGSCHIWSVDSLSVMVDQLVSVCLQYLGYIRACIGTHCKLTAAAFFDSGECLAYLCVILGVLWPINTWTRYSSIPFETKRLPYAVYWWLNRVANMGTSSLLFYKGLQRNPKSEYQVFVLRILSSPVPAEPQGSDMAQKTRFLILE